MEKYRAFGAHGDSKVGDAEFAHELRGDGGHGLVKVAEHATHFAFGGGEEIEVAHGEECAARA